MKSIETPYGTLWAPDEELVPGRILLADGSYPEKADEFAFMRRHIKPGMLCLDVGANCGMSSLMMARCLAGKESLIFAYEPTQDLIPALRRTLNDLCDYESWAFAFDTAVGANDGWGHVTPHQSGSGGNQFHPHTAAHGIGMVRLDTHVHPHERPVGFIKIDAEGMDVDVLCGAVDILEKDRPVVMLEINMSAMRDLGKHPDLEIDTLDEIVLENGYEKIHIEGQNWGLVPK